jgi:predicted RNase H-like HicB family nuclease
MKRYEAQCVRSDGWWAVTVDGLKGVHTQARRLDQVEDMVREAIALARDVEPDAFEVDVRPILDDSTRLAVDEALAQKAAADAAQVAAQRAWRDAARTLVEDGLTVRDAGKVLGVSHQRINQLVND